VLTGQDSLIILTETSVSQGENEDAR
jgi:hypothetical protein